MRSGPVNAESSGAYTPQGPGTRLVVTHGTYADSDAEREACQGHIDGWTHFLARLRALDPS